MYPVLYRIGSHIVYSYTAALALGMLLSLLVALLEARRCSLGAEPILDAGFWALLGEIAGGRLGYIAANWAYYAEHLGKALSLSEGGLSWHGALAGGCLAAGTWFAVRSRRAPPLPDGRDLMDALAPGLALGSALGWTGCLLGGCGYGAEAAGLARPLSWLSARLPDIYGIDKVRFATQPFMIAWCLLLLAVLWTVRGRLPRGWAFVLYLFGYALGDLAVAALRGDGTWRWGLWLSQWVDLVHAFSAVGLGIYLWTRPDARGITSAEAATKA